MRGAVVAHLHIEALQVAHGGRHILGAGLPGLVPTIAPPI